VVVNLRTYPGGGQPPYIPGGVWPGVPHGGVWPGVPHGGVPHGGVPHGGVPHGVVSALSVPGYSRFRPETRAFPFSGYSLGCLRF